MTMTAPLEPANERVLARVGDLRQVLEHVRSPDVRDAVEAAIADIQRRYDLASDPAAPGPAQCADDPPSSRLTAEQGRSVVGCKC